MARLANQANLGYVPLPDDAARMIATYLSTGDQPVRIFDPCAGEGRAIGILAASLGLPTTQVYANELNDQRAEQCAEHAGHVTMCDTLKDLQATRGAFQFAYLNPPFDQDSVQEGGGRLEPKFFHRCIEDGHWVQPGGVVVIVTPQNVLRSDAAIKHLARCYDQLHLVALPAAMRQYREAVVFGIVRDQWRRGRDLRHEAAHLTLLLSEALAELTPQATPRYQLPAPLPVRKCVWRNGARGTPEQAQRDVVLHGGAWAGRAYHAQRQAMHRHALRPLFPLHPAQAALRIANGEINGREVELFGKTQLLKGSTREEAVTWQQQRPTGTARVTETHVIKRQVPQVMTVDADGALRMFLGDQGMAALMRHERTADALLEAVEEAAPPRYALDMADAVAHVLTAIVPVSGRALPGYAPGLLPMQQHCAAALYQALTTSDSSLENVIPDAAVLGAEMGAGKSAMSIAVAELFAQLSDRPRKRRRR